MYNQYVQLQWIGKLLKDFMQNTVTTILCDLLIRPLNEHCVVVSKWCHHRKLHSISIRCEVKHI